MASVLFRPELAVEGAVTELGSLIIIKMPGSIRGEMVLGPPKIPKSVDAQVP